MKYWTGPIVLMLTIAFIFWVAIHQHNEFSDACEAAHGRAVYNGKFWECVK